MPTNAQLLQKSRLFTRIEPTMRSYELAYLGGTIFKENVRIKRSSEDAAVHQRHRILTTNQP
jgi:hypothetical protein